MAKVLNDWAWRPDAITSEALKRGRAKLADWWRRVRHEFGTGVTFGKRRRLTQAELREVARLRSYVEHRRRDNWRFSTTRGNSDAEGESLSVHRWKGRGARKGRGGGKDRLRRQGRKVDRRAVRRGGSMPERGARDHAQRLREIAWGRGWRRGMSWATVLVLDGAKTRAWRRYDSMVTAQRAVNHEPEAQDFPDHMVVHAGTLLSPLSDDELAALAKAFGLKATERTGQLQELKQALATFGPEAQQLSREAAASALKEKGAAAEAAKDRHHAERGGVAVGKLTMEAPAERPRRVNMGHAAKAAKAAKTARPAAAKGAKAEKDPLGRPGSLGRYMCERILEGKLTDEQLVKAAQKAFPDNKVASNYPQWYRNALSRKGLLKEPAKKASDPKEPVRKAAAGKRPARKK